MQPCYQQLPTFTDGSITLRPLRRTDAPLLLPVYSDEAAVPFFNGDNCNGDDFHYATLARMEQAVDFWLYSAQNGYFLRLVIEDAESAVWGTVETCLRVSEDAFNGMVVLRVDVDSRHEKESALTSVLRLLLPHVKEMHGADQVFTKGFPGSPERLAALSVCGFMPSAEQVVGHDGTRFGDYQVLRL